MRIDIALLRLGAALRINGAAENLKIRQLSTRDLIYMSNEYVSKGWPRWKNPERVFEALEKLGPFYLPQVRFGSSPVPNNVSNLPPAVADAAAIKRAAAEGPEDRMSWLHHSWQRHTQCASVTDNAAIQGVAATGLEDRTSWLHSSWQRQAQGAPVVDMAQRANAACIHDPQSGHGSYPVGGARSSSDSAQATTSDASQVTGSDPAEADTALPTTLNQPLFGDSGCDSEASGSEWDDDWEPLTEDELKEANAAFDRHTREIEEFNKRSVGQLLDLGTTAAPKKPASTKEGMPLISQKTSLQQAIVDAYQKRRERLSKEGNVGSAPIDNLAKVNPQSSEDMKAWHDAFLQMQLIHGDGLVGSGDDSGHSSDASNGPSDWESYV